MILFCKATPSEFDASVQAVAREPGALIDPRGAAATAGKIQTISIDDVPAFTVLADPKPGRPCHVSVVYSEPFMKLSQHFQRVARDYLVRALGAVQCAAPLKIEHCEQSGKMSTP
jgi:hypothetical protein